MAIVAVSIRSASGEAASEPLNLSTAYITAVTGVRLFVILRPASELTAYMIVYDRPVLPRSLWWIVTLTLLIFLPGVGFGQQDTTRSPTDTSEVAVPDSTGSSAPATQPAGSDSTEQATDSLRAPAEPRENPGQPADSAGVTRTDSAAGDLFLDDEIRAVARAVEAVEQIRQKYYSRQGLPATGDQGADSLYTSFKREVNRVVRQHGLTIELYRRVLQAARRNPEIRQRLVTAAEELRQE